MLAVIMVMVVIVMVVVIVTMVRVCSPSWASGTNRLDRGSHVNLAGLFKDKRQLQLFTRLERLLQAHEHDVVAAGAERHRLAGWHLDRFDAAHLHHAVLM